MILSLRRVAPNAQLLLMEAGCPHCLAKAHLLQLHRDVARHYNLPVVDYAAMVAQHNRASPNSTGPDMLWPFSAPANQPGTPFTQIGASWPNFVPKQKVTHQTCEATNHPPWQVHQYVADAVTYALRQMLDSTCKRKGRISLTQDAAPFRPLSPGHELDRVTACVQPLSSYSATRPSEKPTVVSGNWTLYEDVAGRPGWISTEQGSIIRFPVRIGRSPMLTITYLHSYKGLGNAKVSLIAGSGSSTNTVLEGMWSKKYSLLDTKFYIGRMDGLDGNFMAKLLTREHVVDSMGINQRKQIFDYDLQIENLGDKFKIVSVNSC
eukprot:gnl/TRDRNA2_/TRDRNA2_85617_c0_seq1.p1 gnl/TRDRNA2_/TRDRNA2_85617_c0~~gnl/TRDRNA2_/TRDRNA2_85617_c0_seq1.p1  ORF type:complete len:373 (-),score=35.90 gnl/TRDRNA2_/TRDRNA2_85617_c0_seq1:378-1340(-)